MDANQIKTIIENAFEEFKKDLIQFISRIQWDDRFIQGLMVFHMVMLISVVYFRHDHTAIFCLLTLSALIIFFAERLNELGMKYWKLFSKRPYFDKNGSFITVMVSLPLLMISLLSAILLVHQMTSLMVKAKRKELKSKDKKYK